MDAFVVVHENLLKKAIIGQPGHPDWSGILNLLNVIESQPQTLQVFIELFVKHLKKDPNGLKLNTLMVIDALFKNGKKNQLKQLQGKTLIQELDQREISEDPTLHNFIYQNAAMWVTACRDQNCLIDDFSKWQLKFCSTHYVPELTPSLIKKFFKELDSGTELLTVFSECLITTFAEGGKSSDHQLLDEIVVNSRELERRIDKLLPTLNDPALRTYCAKVFELAKICNQAYDQLMKTGAFDTSILTKAFNNVQAEKSKRGVSDAPQEEKVHKRKPIRTAGDDITDEDFWNQLHELKTKVAQPAPLIQLDNEPQKSQNPVDLLLGF